MRINSYLPASLFVLSVSLVAYATPKNPSKAEILSTIQQKDETKEWLTKHELSNDLLLNLARFDLKSEETQFLDLPLPVDVIEDLNDQNKIQSESAYNAYYIDDSKLFPTLPEASITYRILNLIYELYPVLRGNLKIQIRSSIMSNHVDDNSSTWHRDQPGAKNSTSTMKLIFSWGPGTQAFDFNTSTELTRRLNEMNHLAINDSRLYHFHPVNYYAETYPETILENTNGRLLKIGPWTWHKRANVSDVIGKWRYFISFSYNPELMK